MHADSFVFSVFLIFAGAAALASVALFSRQPLIIAYIVLGMIIGPHGMNFIEDAQTLSSIGRIGIMFLLFLLGLDLNPRNFGQILSRTAVVTVGSALLLGGVGYGFCLALGFSTLEALLIGVAIGFSSTIIGIKLLPTTVLHHKHVGEMLVAILLVQDMLAIIVLILMSSVAKGQGDAGIIVQLLLGLPALIVGAFLAVRFVILPLIARFDRFQEYIFLLAIGWCLAVAQIAELLHLSFEIGAFIAGISLANSPIAQWIATHLKPLRDFFLILFFFTIGASINLAMLGEIWWAAILLATLVIVIKPWCYRFLLSVSGEEKETSQEVGWRLGQISEFSLLISYMGLETALMSEKAASLLQSAAILTFMISTYIVVLRFPSPIAISDRLRRD
jgi:Kef-type K+ transport system membrane component KefB